MVETVNYFESFGVLPLIEAIRQRHNGPLSFEQLKSALSEREFAMLTVQKVIRTPLQEIVQAECDAKGYPDITTMMIEEDKADRAAKRDAGFFVSPIDGAITKKTMPNIANPVV